MKPKRKRQDYPKEFRDDAVKLVIEKGYICTEVSRRLGTNGMARASFHSETSE